MDRNIKFEGDQVYRSRNAGKSSGMRAFLIKNKIVKNGAQANLLLLFAALILLIVSLGIMLSQQTEPEPVFEPDPDTLLRPN
jgi:hypothetical protein